jgi:hypothetical protein
MPNPDLLYRRSRESLLSYEDSRMNSLVNAMSDFYTTRNDNSLFGTILRALAKELAHLEYFYAYDLVTKQPQFLTPPDIKRRWAGPLFISSDYPLKFPVQYDVQYRAMLVALIKAYQEGATTKSIHDVILAYTGLNISVVELYRFIGNGIYDQSDANTLQVSVNVGGPNPLEDIQNLLQLQPITADLYGAMDLAKPAHVGIHFATVLGSDENIDAYVTDVLFSPIFGISDLLRIYVQIVEQEPLGPMLIQAPILNPANPQTTIAAYGRVFPAVLTPTEWAALTSVNPTTELEEIFAVEPSLPSWQPTTSYAIGDRILDGNYNVQTVTVAGVSGGVVPTFTQALNGTTLDHIGNPLMWIMTAPTAKTAYTAPAPSSAGNYILNEASRNWIILMNPDGTPTGYLANYDPTHPAGLVAPQLDRSWEISGGDASYIFELT